MADTGHSSRPDVDCKGRWNVDTLHHHFERWLLLMEKYYDAKFREINEATDKALMAVKDQTAAAFAANKEAVLKTEDAQKAYNTLHNDLERKIAIEKKDFVHREKMDDLEKHFNEKLDSVMSEIARLREVQFETGGRRVQQQENRATSQWTVSSVITVIFGLLGTLTFLFALLQFFLKSQHP